MQIVIKLLFYLQKVSQSHASVITIDYDFFCDQKSLSVWATARIFLFAVSRLRIDTKINN
jgi:hypothetical protein